ncbi:hypothetical protein EMIT0P218_140039 [Pseudomonas sp. IT-P218]
MQLAFRVEGHAESRLVECRQAHATVHRYRFAEQLRMEHRHHFVGFGRHHQEFGERAVMPGGHEVIAVHRRAVGNDQGVVGVGQGRDLHQFGEAAAPADIRLDDVAAAHLQQHAEAPAGGFMFAGGHQHAFGHVVAQGRVAPVIVRRQGFFDPLQAMFVGADRQSGGVVEVQAHPAIEHQPEVRPDPFAHGRQFFEVLAQAFLAFGRAMVQRHLAADKTHFLRQVRAGAGGVELQFIAHRAAEQLVHRLLADLAEQVPQRQVDPGNRVDHDAFAPVIQGRLVHLVPDLFDVGDFRPFEEARQVFLDDVGGRLAARGHRKTDRAVAGFDLHHQGAEHVDAEGAAALAVLRVFAHRRGNVIVDPVAIGLIVVIRAAASQSESADVLDGWNAHGVIPFFNGGQV